MDSLTIFKRIYKQNRLDPDLEYLFEKLTNERSIEIETYYFLRGDWYWLDRFIRAKLLKPREIINDAIYDISDHSDEEALLNFAIHYWKEDGCPYIDDVWDSVNTIQVLNIFIKNRICPYYSSMRLGSTSVLEMFYMDNHNRLCDRSFLVTLLEYMTKWMVINGNIEYFERNVTREEYIQELFLKYDDRSVMERVFSQNSGKKNLIFTFLDIGVNINQVIETINITMNNREIDWRFDFKIIFHYGLILNKIHIDENTDKYFYKRYNGLYKCWYRWRFLAHKKRFSETLVAVQWHPKSQRVAEIANHFASLKSI